jgi:predicted Zn finger-like uncharacterized protein
MKFVCERCHTRYSIADDKVRQKILKIRCKTCENVITVRDSGPVATTAFGQSPHGAAPPPPPRGPAPSREWFVAINGEQTGPMTRSDIARRVLHCKSEDEVYVWKDGQDGWKPPEEVPVIQQEINTLKARPSGPVPRLPAPPPNRAGKPSAPVRATKPLPSAFAGQPRAGASPATARAPEAEAFADEEHTQIQPFDAGVLAAEMLGRPAAPAGSNGSVLPFATPAHHRQAAPAAAPAALDGLFSDLTPAPIAEPGAPSAPASPALSTGLAALAARKPPTMKLIAAAGVMLVLVGVVVVVMLSRPAQQPPVIPTAAQVAKAPEPAAAEEAPRPVIEPEQPPRPAPTVREVTRRTGKQAATRSHVALTPPPAQALEPAPLSPDQVAKPHPVAAGERRVPEFRSTHPSTAAKGGPSDGAIGAVVKRRENQLALKTCYERALKRDDRLRSARIDVSASVGMSGIVKSVSLAAPPEFATVESCIKTAVRHWSFPANSEEYQIDFPILLQGNQ